MKADRTHSLLFRLLLLSLCGFLLTGCVSSPAKEVQVLVDGQAWSGTAALPENDLRVVVTLQEKVILELPFGEAHTVRIVQPDVGENILTMTGDAVSMTEADCPGQDCVRMETITRENLEIRPLGGFIVCLPHQLTVEVREPRGFRGAGGD